MTRHYVSIRRVGLSMGLVLLLAAGSAGAASVAWDMVNSTSYNLTSHTTDAPPFGSAGDGFQMYAAVPQVCPPAPSSGDNLNNIPYSLVDDSACIYVADTLGVIDSMTDFDDFFGVTDTVNDDNLSGLPYNATWVFDISAATNNLELSIDLAAMGNFEPADVYQWTYQVDSGPVVPIFAAVANEDGSQTYTMANPGTPLQVLDDPLVVDGTTLSDVFQTFTTPIAAGSQLTVVLTAVTDGGYEGYLARNIMVTGDVDVPPDPGAGGLPVPTLSRAGSAAVVLLLMFVGVVLIRRFN